MSRTADRQPFPCFILSGFTESMVCRIQITQSRQVIEYIPQVHLLYRRASIVESMSIIVQVVSMLQHLNCAYIGENIS